MANAQPLAPGRKERTVGVVASSYRPQHREGGESARAEIPGLTRGHGRARLYIPARAGPAPNTRATHARRPWPAPGPRQISATPGRPAHFYAAASQQYQYSSTMHLRSSAVF